MLLNPNQSMLCERHNIYFSTCNMYYFLYLFETPAGNSWIGNLCKKLKCMAYKLIIFAIIYIFLKKIRETSGYTLHTGERCSQLPLLTEWAVILQPSQREGVRMCRANARYCYFSGLFHILIITMDSFLMQVVEIKLLYNVEKIQVEMQYRTVVNWRNTACHDSKITCTISVAKGPAPIRVNVFVLHVTKPCESECYLNCYLC